MKRILAITLILVMTLAVLTGCNALQNSSIKDDEETKISKYLTEENGVYTLTLPKSKQKITLRDEQIRFVPYITDPLVEAAENKITDDISEYSNNSDFYLQITDDYLCLTVEVIIRIDLSAYSEPGCEYIDIVDHTHLFFSERISNRSVAEAGKTEFGTSDKEYKKIQFFPQPILEFKEESYDITEFEWSLLSDDDMNLLRQIYNDGKVWINDSLVDRTAFYFDGRIRYADMGTCGWMYFGFDQNVLYYNGKFKGIDAKVMDILERVQKAINSRDNGSQGDESLVGHTHIGSGSITITTADILAQKILSDPDKQIILNILDSDREWASGIPACDWICRFTGPSVNIGYCDCGTLSDLANDRSRKLTAEERESIEALIARCNEDNSNDDLTHSGHEGIDYTRVQIAIEP